MKDQRRAGLHRRQNAVRGEQLKRRLRRHGADLTARDSRFARDTDMMDIPVQNRSGKLCRRRIGDQ